MDNTTLHHYEKMNIFYTIPGRQIRISQGCNRRVSISCILFHRDVTGNIVQSRWRMFRISKSFYEVKTGFGEKKNYTYGLRFTCTKQLCEQKMYDFSVYMPFKHNEQVKSAVNEPKDATVGGKNEACIGKLNKGIHLIDQRQKLILIADKSVYGWKTVGECLDKELINDDQGTKKMKNEESRKEAQWKIVESHAAKAVKAHTWFRNPRSLGNKRKVIATIQPFFSIRRKLFSSFFFLRGRSKKYRFTSIFKWDGSKVRHML